MNKQKTNQSASSGDSGFDDLLRSAKVAVPLPGAFHAEVWTRIAVSQEITLAGRFLQLLEAFLGAVTQPIGASAILLAMITGGLWFGSMGGETLRDAQLDYVQSVSPFAYTHGEVRR